MKVFVQIYLPCELFGKQINKYLLGILSFRPVFSNLAVSLSNAVKCSILFSPLNLVAALRLFLYGVTLILLNHLLLEVSQPAIIAAVRSMLCTVCYSVVQFVTIL